MRWPATSVGRTRGGLDARSRPRRYQEAFADQRCADRVRGPLARFARYPDRDRLEPERVFLNDYTRRVLGT
jgi:hypothetical protein